MIRKLKFNGLWYPTDKEELLSLVKISHNIANKDRFAVVPHAGLYYSSPLIKLFFNTLNPDINKIILLTPSHYYSLEDNVIGSGNFEMVESPFNKIKGFNLDLFQRGYEKVTIDEHAVEMILPFIGQLENIKLCCAHVNRFTNTSIATEWAKKLLSTIDDKTAVIASSDFTHYGSNFNYTPFGINLTNDVINQVTSYDKNIATSFINGKASLAYQKATVIDKATICGIAPMLVVSEMARLRGMKGRILGQSNSINKSIRDNNFVSYLSLAWRD